MKSRQTSCRSQPERSTECQNEHFEASRTPVPALQCVERERPYQWRLHERTSRARTLLLETDASLSEVAIACGFSDQGHFTRALSTVVGVTPGMWRRTF